MWVIRSRWLCARPQQLHSVSNGATAALRQALDMVSSRNVGVQISIAISSPRHHNNNNKLYLNIDFTIYNPHLALIVYVVPILNVMLGGEENLSHRKIQHFYDASTICHANHYSTKCKTVNLTVSYQQLHRYLLHDRTGEHCNVTVALPSLWSMPRDRRLSSERL